MRFLKFLLIILIIGALGYGGYHYGTQFVSNKISDTVTTEIGKPENINEIKVLVNENPELKAFIEEGMDIDEGDLLFTTTEEAIQTIVQNIDINELQKIQATYQEGISQNEMQELIKDLEGKLTEEEILALKAIAYKELYE